MEVKVDDLVVGVMMKPLTKEEVGVRTGKFVIKEEVEEV